MSGKKTIWITLGFVLSVSLIASVSSVLLVSHHYNQLRFELLNTVCEKVAAQNPENKKVIADTLKEYRTGSTNDGIENDILSAFGYRISDFSGISYGQSILFAAIGFGAAGLLFIFTFLYRNKLETIRIQNLAEYLEQANTTKAAIIVPSREDEFSKLEDEIYKTVTSLYQTKDLAIQAKNYYAENLSNIAHQIKTPITAISLSVQRMEAYVHDKHLKQIEKQLLRLTSLEEALLVLARIDAGTLLFHKDEVDIFTLLVLAADNLQELSDDSGTTVDIPELGEMLIHVDLDWTMEAIMNLMKNGIEHNPRGTIYCSYAQNPLYTEILIWDDGDGFAKEDIQHLFERFYRGQNATENGIGIGLALSKEIIEQQNGTIRAKNRPEGGALFEIHFYRH